MRYRENPHFLNWKALQTLYAYMHQYFKLYLKLNLPYEQLSSTFNRIRTSEHIYLLGDFNAKVGAVHYVIEKMNKNCMTLLELLSQLVHDKHTYRTRHVIKHPDSNQGQPTGIKGTWSSSDMTP